MKPKVLHVIDHTQSGGAQNVVGQIIRSLGNQFTFLVAVLGKSGMYSRKYGEAGALVFELGSHLGKWDVLSLQRLASLCRKQRVDLIHTALFKSHIVGGAAAQFGNQKLIVHDHSGIFPSSVEHFLPSASFRRIYLKAYRQVLHWSDQALVLTEADRRGYAKAFPECAGKVSVVPNAVDLQEFAGIAGTPGGRELWTQLGLASSTRFILTVGRLAPEKDHVTFLHVAQEVSRRCDTPVAFLIVGEGECEHRLKRCVSSGHIEGVFFLGQRHDVPWLLSQADVFLLTSQREPFSIAVLEAMAARCPVVATRSGGPDAILSDGKDGLLADVGDVQGLANCVVRLLGDGAFRQEISARAYETVASRYTLERFAAQVAGTYRSVLEES